MFMNMYVHGYVYVYDSICWALKCPVHCAEPFLELKICISPQFRAIDPPNPARGFIQQNENVRFATAACMQKYGNVSFATVACAKCMRYGGRGGTHTMGGGGGGGNTGHGTIYIYIYMLRFSPKFLLVSQSETGHLPWDWDCTMSCRKTRSFRRSLLNNVRLKNYWRRRFGLLRMLSALQVFVTARFGDIRCYDVLYIYYYTYIIYLYIYSLYICILSYIIWYINSYIYHPN